MTVQNKNQQDASVKTKPDTSRYLGQNRFAVFIVDLDII